MQRWFSLVLSFFWAILSIVGYFCWSWDVGQTTVFINIGFFSLFFNYYLIISELSYKSSIAAALAGKHDNSDLARPLVVMGKCIGFILNQFLFTFALGVVCMVNGGLIAVYFYKVLKVEDFDGFLMKWNGEWTTVISVSLLLLTVEYLGFRRQFLKLNPYKITDWSAFLPFSKNSKYKLISYVLGSVIIGCIDGFLNDEKHFGYISLAWMFFCNFLWAYIDTFHPPKEKTLEEYRTAGES